jgi:hypothetical protein
LATTAPQKFKCTQPGCDKEYNDAAHRGIHLRAAHGIKGRSHQAIKRREERAAAAKAALLAQPKRKYTKRSTDLAIRDEKANEQINHSTNGFGQAATRRFAAETAVAVALSRFKDLCTSVAVEYDLPPRSFAARFRELIAAEALW